MEEVKHVVILSPLQICLVGRSEAESRSQAYLTLFTLQMMY